MDNLEKNRAIIQFQKGIAKVESLGFKFVPYSTRFVHVGTEHHCVIKGSSTKNGKRINEFCYGRDADYGQTHLLDVYEMPDGIKYAAIERSMGVYAFWEVLD